MSPWILQMPRWLWPRKGWGLGAFSPLTVTSTSIESTARMLLRWLPKNACRRGCFAGPNGREPPAIIGLRSQLFRPRARFTVAHDPSRGTRGQDAVRNRFGHHGAGADDRVAADVGHDDSAAADPGAGADANLLQQPRLVLNPLGWVRGAVR